MPNRPSQTDPPQASAAERGLAAVLRRAAGRAAQSTGGGMALVFARESSESAEATPRLRAAAGFASPEAAREISARVEAAVLEAMQGGDACHLPGEGMGLNAAQQAVVVPLRFDGRTHGALVAAGKSAASDLARGLGGIAESLSLHLDHAHLAARAARVEQELATQSQAAEKKTEELLELSEALFAQDIELLRSQERLGKIEKLKNDFIEKMSRELRTPLNSIIESIIQVLAGENETLSGPAQESLRRALDEGTSFLRTLQNILDLWRLKQGELPLEMQEVNFREVVEEAIFSVQDTLGEKPVTIDKQLAQPFPKIRTDLAKLNHILFLLLDNAAKFTDRGQIQIEARVDEGMLRCEVRDTGIGICSDDQQFIFDEFYQVDELSSTRYRGAGLGLTLVRDLMVLLDGSFSLSSEVGSGTTVSFEVPVQVLG